MAKKYFTEGIDAIEEAYFHFFPATLPTTAIPNEQTRKEQQTPKPTQQMQSPNTLSIFKKFLSKKVDENHVPISVDTLARTQKIELKKEVGEFSNLVASEEFSKVRWSTKQFWQSHQLKFPKLFKLSRVLLNIPTSSAFIERFFSICGIISKKRSMNMDDELFIARCLFKANIHI